MQPTRRNVLIGAGTALLAGALPAHATGVQTTGGPAFGTFWRITLPDGEQIATAARTVRSIAAFVDGAMSPFRPDSEISRFNAADTLDWQVLSPETSAVVAEGLRIAALTGGAFDPTVGPIVARFGFGPIHKAEGGSYTDISVGDGAARKDRPEATLDLCGIAKGYALDRMVAALDALGVANFLLELGGEVFGRGTHPSGRPWQIGVERPMPGPISFQRIVRLDSPGLATSGDASNAYTIAGRRYSHIIDPHRQEPADNGIASVSVLMPTVATADALATALVVLGPEDGAALAERQAIPALFIVRDGTGFREVMTAGFSAAVIS